MSFMFQDQKEAVEKGLITMQDVEMAVADGMFSYNLILVVNCLHELEVVTLSKCSNS